MFLQLQDNNAASQTALCIWQTSDRSLFLWHEYLLWNQNKLRHFLSWTFLICIHWIPWWWKLLKIYLLVSDIFLCIFLVTCADYKSLIKCNEICAFRLENVPVQYHDGYSKLRSWTYSSLDLYKVTCYCVAWFLHLMY